MLSVLCALAAIEGETVTALIAGVAVVKAKGRIAVAVGPVTLMPIDVRGGD